MQEFRDAPGFILAKRPSEIRAIAQVPVVRTMAFEMASNGDRFQVCLPTKKRFFVARREDRSVRRSGSKTSGRSHILEALLIEPPHEDEVAVLENAIEGLTPYQVVYLIRLDNKQKPKLTRKFWFSRDTLELSRMQILDDLGDSGDSGSLRTMG